MEQSVFRPLTDTEIAILIANGCRTAKWESIEVTEKFDANLIFNCSFSGNIRIGNNVKLSNVGLIENYTISGDTVIANVGEIVASANGSAMGNGVEVATVNENGGRSVAIFGKLTAQIAYIEAMYRHRPVVVKKMKEWARFPLRKYGTVGASNTITNCGSLRDIITTFGVKINGATTIHDSTVYTNAFIGAGTKIYSSIVAKRCVVDNGTMLKRCFVGEASTVDNFTAVDSLIFSNCELSNGEAVSIFAAPYTVSHHKSSLLIAGMFSFFNAGSGSNQSNHLFKQGAVHQGIHRRGVKFASNAYVMLPAVDGAFTTVIGRHKKHHNTENLPFSLLIEIDGDSWVRPAMNLTSSGLWRDNIKWSKRDKRSIPNTADIINFEAANPFITERVERGIAVLESLLERGEDVCTFERIKMRRSWIERGLQLYRLAWDMYVGRMLEAERPSQWITTTSWLDVAGQYMSREAMEQLLNDVETDRFSTAEEFITQLQHINGSYSAASYCWAYERLTDKLGHAPDQIEIDDAIERGRRNAETFKRMSDIDQQKDLSSLMKVSYGLDWGAEECEADFRAVRM